MLSRAAHAIWICHRCPCEEREERSNEKTRHVDEDLSTLKAIANSPTCEAVATNDVMMMVVRRVDHAES